MHVILSNHIRYLFFILIITMVKKGKAIPVTGREDPDSHILSRQTTHRWR
jgi:hypothetical protein